MLNRYNILTTTLIITSILAFISTINANNVFDYEYYHSTLKENNYEYGPKPNTEQVRIETKVPLQELTPELQRVIDSVERKQNAERKESRRKKDNVRKKRHVNPYVRPVGNEFGDTAVHRSPISIEQVVRMIHNSKSVEETRRILENSLQEAEDSTVKLQIEEMLKNPEKTFYTYGPESNKKFKLVHIFQYIIYILIYIYIFILILGGFIQTVQVIINAISNFIKYIFYLYF